MTFNTSNFIEAFRSAIAYVPVTLKLTFVSFAIGILFGMLIAIIRFYRVPILSQFFSLVITVYMGIPLMVVLVVSNLIFLTSFDSLASLLHIQVEIKDVDPIFLGYIVLGFSAICSIGENIRGAFRAIDKVQFEAGYSIGLTKVQTLRRIIIPQMIPIVIPGLVNNLVGIVKGTNLVAAISVVEVMGGALIPCVKTYSFLEGYVAAAIVYWIIIAVLEQIAKQIEKHSRKYQKLLA